MKRIAFPALFLILSLKLVSAQETFHGSFYMYFTGADGSSKDSPLNWHIQSASKGGKMEMEILDDMKKRGVSKRVLFSPSDSTWTMLMEYVNTKIGTRIHAAAMYRDSSKQQKITIRKTESKRRIEGYRCKKIILESEHDLAEVWITDQLKFDLCYIYKLLSHCGLMNEFVRKGDWFNWKESKGMILEVTSKSKISGESYTMHVSKLIAEEIDPSVFNVDGFKISDIPEGFNCGLPIENK